MSAIVGTAGWTIPGRDAQHFPGDDSALQRYARQFGGVEVNSSFHRAHRYSTWLRWGESVPLDFNFAVKVPKTITHERKLVDFSDPLTQFLEEVSALGEKLAVLLLQLPPKLSFEQDLIQSFLEALSSLTSVRIVCEPRHPSWFEDGPDHLLDRFGVARVAADPACTPAASLPGGWRGLSYWRLHGSPQMYRSSYDEVRLDAYASLLRSERTAGRPTWCIFDNTAAAAATGDALAIRDRL